MITKASYIVEECPVCGRPVEIQCEYLGRQLACQHCQGVFLVTEDGVQLPEWIAKCHHLLAAADHSLEVSATGSAATAEHPVRKPRHPSFVERGPDFHPPARCDAVEETTLPDVEAAEDCKCPAETDRPRILLVEHRDEVFARLGADMAGAGFRVIRATTALEALKQNAKHPFALVVANLDLPDQSGWLLAAKLHFVGPPAAIWLYKPRQSPGDTAMAEFLRVDELLAYGGDLLGLSDVLVARLANQPESWSGSKERAGEHPVSQPSLLPDTPSAGRFSQASRTI